MLKTTSSRRERRHHHGRGERHPRAWLTDADIALIRALRAEGLTYGAIAAKFERPDGTPAPLSTIKSICWETRR